MPTADATAEPRSGAHPPLRLLVVGAGRMGRVHLGAIADAASVVTAAVVEPFEPARQALTGVTAYAGLDEALVAGGFDAALVAAPSSLHGGIVAALLDAGVPTLCEKPLGLTSAVTAQAAAHAGRAGVPLQIGYWRRFVPELQMLHQRIADGEFGEIALIQAWQWDGEPPAAAFRATSGGPMLDMGVHEFDMIRWLTGEELTIAEVVASSVNSVEPVPGDPESVLAVGRLSGGGVAAISLGRRYDRGDCCWVEVIGTRSSQRCEFMVGAEGDAVFRAALVRQLDAFAALVAGGPASGAQAADAVAALAIAEAGAAALASGRS